MNHDAAPQPRRTARHAAHPLHRGGPGRSATPPLQSVPKLAPSYPHCTAAMPDPTPVHPARPLNATALAAAALLALAGPAQAIVSSTTSSNWLATDDAFDGVARLVIDGSSGCSGSLLAGGAYVLTAAHCVTDDSGTIDASRIALSFDGGRVTAAVSSTAQISVDAGWNGTLGLSNDLALLRLDSAVTGITGYTLASGDLLGSTVVLAGYGLSGTGATGAVSGSFGTLHWGENQYEALYDGSGSAVLFDFDNGTRQRSSLGGTGLGTSEAGIASGDSGGPSFIVLAGQLLLAGVHSFGARLADPRYDVDGLLNSSWGELGGDSLLTGEATRAWILAATAVPEPAAWALWLAGLGAGCAARRRRAA